MWHQFNVTRAAIRNAWLESLALGGIVGSYAAFNIADTSGLITVAPFSNTTKGDPS